MVPRWVLGVVAAAVAVAAADVAVLVVTRGGTPARHRRRRRRSLGHTELMEFFRWRRWWSRDGLPALRVMAVEHWDPQNVYDDATRADAYDPYLERVGRMLRRGKGSEEIAHYLGLVRTKAMQLDESETTDELFADRVVAWYRLEAPEA